VIPINTLSSTIRLLNLRSVGRCLEFIICCLASVLFFIFPVLFFIFQATLLPSTHHGSAGYALIEKNRIASPGIGESKRPLSGGNATMFVNLYSLQASTGVPRLVSLTRS